MLLLLLLLFYLAHQGTAKSVNMQIHSFNLKFNF